MISGIARHFGVADHLHQWLFIKGHITDVAPCSFYTQR